jgi:hypothetical protein
MPEGLIHSKLKASYTGVQALGGGVQAKARKEEQCKSASPVAFFFFGKDGGGFLSKACSARKIPLACFK